ncbi:hypothetical protein SARC_10306 [Sphaeroforma arctica JP610]|uniref:PKD domain-containing protein n=1 Tax=Sphaeroforma arctica JP610 TaxID=667725 RepID=A0A0L0FKC8_9EUKA|nr:hypothetical protein SARC_10306 [Sphaeroforma arctica JP610]KNC77229.1 hypothetical protein SARC_10306 [Sphaeroforma arctica JP610]|eukprot:XP_014151131.1 hypothetical protein SARC_10306 [Sphaeroforma arctica JP610]
MLFKSKTVATVLAVLILDFTDARQTASIFNPFATTFNPVVTVATSASVTPTTSVFNPFGTVASTFNLFNTAVSSSNEATILTSGGFPIFSTIQFPSTIPDTTTVSSTDLPTFTIDTSTSELSTSEFSSTSTTVSFITITSTEDITTTSTEDITTTTTEDITTTTTVADNTTLTAVVNGPYTAVQFIPQTFSADGSSANAQFYIWTFGDEIPGRTNTTVVLGTEVSHTYTEAGIFDVCLIVEVDGERSDADCTEVDVAVGVTVAEETTTTSSTSTTSSTTTTTTTEFVTGVVPGVTVDIENTEGTGTNTLTTDTLATATVDPLDTVTKTSLTTTNVATVVVTTLEPSDGVDGESGFFVDFSGLFGSDEESETPIDLSGLQADAGGPYYGSVGVNIEFDASLTTPGGDGDLQDLSFQWRFGDETATTPSTVVNGSTVVDHTYLAVNEYRVCLTVIQGDGASVDCTTAFIEANEEIVTAERAENLLTEFNEEDWDEVGTGFSVANGVLLAEVNGGGYQEVKLNQTRTGQLFLQCFTTAFDYSAFTDEQSLPVLRVMVFYEDQLETVENFSFRAPESSEGGETLSYVINPALPVKNATVYALHIGDVGQSTFEDIFFGPVVLF